MSARDTDWQPGDPLHPTPGTFPRELFEVMEDLHPWVDAATWPDPGRRDLGPGDELGDLIAWHRQNRRESA